MDTVGRAESRMSIGSDMPGHITRSPGGVALNIAAALRRFGMKPAILTAIGKDPEGDDLLGELERIGLQCDHVYRPDDLPTDSYIAIEDAGGMIAAIASAHSLEKVGDRILQPLKTGDLSTKDKPIIIDGNLSIELLRSISKDPILSSSDLRIASASPGKARRLQAFMGHSSATLYVNLEEAGLLCETTFSDSAIAAAAMIDRGAYRTLVTDGRNPATEATRASLITQTPPVVPISRVTGAGDTLMAAHVAAEIHGETREAALSRSLQAAAAHISGRNQS